MYTLQQFLVTLTALVAASSLHPVGAAHLQEGDILLTPEQQATLEATSNPNDPFAPQQAVVRNPRSLWPNAVVPYVIDGSLGMKRHCNVARTSKILEYTRKAEIVGLPAFETVSFEY